MEQVQSQPFVIEQTYNAPINKVWSALTNVDEMRQWYFNLAGFKPEVGFEFSFKGGPPEKEYNHLCRITNVIPGKLLAHTWQYEGYAGNSEVKRELFDQHNQTLVKLTHSGLNTFPDEPDFASSNFEMGWTHIVGTGLKAYVEKHK